MKIFTHIPRESWIIDRIGQEFKENSRFDVSTDNLQDTDLIWILAPWCWRQIPPQALAALKVVCTIHHQVPEKFNEQDFMLRDQFVDMYHVPCKQTKDFISKFTKKPITQLGYWVNTDLWFEMDKNECKRKLDIPEDAFTVGSFQRDTEGSDLKTPKLEKGPDRFCDYVERLNKKKPVHVVLNAWRRQYVMNRLNAAGIPYTYRELPGIDIVREMYAACDLYVVGSRWEGGPQSILECSVMNVPIVSSDVGMAPDVLPQKCIIDVEKKLYAPTKTDLKNAHKNAMAFEMHRHIKEYDKLFESML